MLIFIGCIGIIGLIRVITYLKLKDDKVFVVFSMCFIFAISALRSIYFGPDVLGYVSKYISLSSVNITTLWKEFIDGAGKDPIFYLFSKMISMLGANYQIWLAIISGIFCIACFKLIDRYSNEPYLSIVALFALGYLYFSFTGLRQTIALSIVILSYKYLRERRFLPFAALVLFSSLFHSSAIIFLVAYFIQNIKIGWKQVIGISVAFILANFFNEQIHSFLYSLNITDNYSYYIQYGTTASNLVFFVHLFIYLFCLFYKKEVLKADPKNLSLYNLLFLGLIFQSFSVVIAEAFRISMYFNIFSIILIPKAISKERSSEIKIIIYLIVFVMLITYALWLGSYDGFKFCWQ